MADALKVILVDDESLVRGLLRDAIDWKANGYEVVREASNAHEALALIEEVHPDVIFTDIYMPSMNGLEFAQIVSEQYPGIQIVILTGYEEFEYARKSVKIGVADFLLKPINDDEIVKVLKNIKAKIEEERNKREEYERMKRHLEENLPYLREKLLNQLLQGRFTEDAILQRIGYFQVEIDPAHIQIAVIEAEDAGSGEEDNILLKMQCRDLCAMHFGEAGCFHVFLDNAQNTVVLNSNRAVDLGECLESLKAALINKLGCQVCIGVGNAYAGLHQIKTSYREACDALHYHVIAGKNQVIHYDDINVSGEEKSSIQGDFLESFAFYLKAGIKKKAMELLDEAFDECAKKGANIDSIRVLALNILSSAMNVTTGSGIRIADVFPADCFDTVFRLDTLPDMQRYVSGLIQEAAEGIRSLQHQKVNQIIQKVTEYIHENLSDTELSLTRTAKAFYINISYLSRIFKQETGQTFVEYLTKARMDKAIRLLQETHMKAYQIAEAVGIADPHYFGICFKKYTGMTINEFKKTDAG